jgi:GT2 family glycosyltransferase
MPLISIIVVSWNVKEYLRRCLNSLKPGVDSGYCEVLVVDNASGDGSADTVRQYFPWVKLMALTENVGFAAANNLAFKQTQGEILLLLNPDTEIEQDFLQNLLNFYKQSPSVGVVGGRIINENGTIQPSVRRFPGLWSSLLDSLKLLRRFPTLAPHYLARDFNYNKTQIADQVMGACFAIRREWWQKLNGFDENFWIWFEEADFCKRVWQDGGEVWYNQQMIVKHTGAASFSQLSYFERHRLFTRSLLHYLYKHNSRTVWFLIWLVSRPMFLITYLIDRVVPLPAR